ncbi:5-oxoprolinase subunit PxpB [Paenibacillus allorhizosphaerae]|uniref:5-oxoprolinase subunit B n=1 Tax=Paenibacillus allorhizosphaerae TaxID=2849866 RepID=A0ABN7TVD8_9BACL|nr:5-oxoprolinase subunit PxpB [Paenibacillus allorhizosphaerae]CAG7656479.1 5-oxoprolinase subunit B [Paenibacillus allorhizosphaerae]
MAEPVRELAEEARVLAVERKEGGYELYPLGEEAVVIRFQGGIGERTRRRVDAAERMLNRKKPGAVIEWVRAYTSVTVYYDPWLVFRQGIGSAAGGSDQAAPYEQVREWLSAELDACLGTEADEAAEVGQCPVRVIPVRFGGEAGPDLPAIAAQSGLSAEEVVELYCSAEYIVHMIGFTPGFPYLGGLPERLACPRRSVPRTIVPAGSVGIAGVQTGIYPLATPGGWQLIGRTPLRLFDPERETPSLLRPGERVRFEAVTPEGYAELEGSLEQRKGR